MERAPAHQISSSSRTELRRRARNSEEHSRRFFCIVDFLVTFYVLGKGRSSSKRLSRICRHITDVSLASAASGLIPMTLWTIKTYLMANLSCTDHLRFLGITQRTRSSYERAVAVAAFLSYCRALRGRLPRATTELENEFAEYLN